MVPGFSVVQQREGGKIDLTLVRRRRFWRNCWSDGDVLCLAACQLGKGGASTGEEVGKRDRIRIVQP